MKRDGAKTPSKIKASIENWLMYKRKHKLLYNTDLVDSASRRYLIRILGSNTEVSREHKDQPRRIDILLSKARTNR